MSLELEENAILKNTLPAIYLRFSKSILIRGCREVTLYLAPEATSSSESNIQVSKPGPTIQIRCKPQIGIVRFNAGHINVPHLRLALLAERLREHVLDFPPFGSASRQGRTNGRMTRASQISIERVCAVRP